MDRYRRLAATGALVLGVAAGSYGVASAASGSGLTAAAPSAAVQSAPPAAQQWGHQRSDETLLTGDTKSKVEAAATAKLPGATVIRTETDADGNAAYEVHMVKQDGTPATVYVDRSFGVVKVETGMPSRPQRTA
ncbi:MAG TPA: hypothetical protein VFA88_08585 [Gaiellaceae bacterium]|nr:hypothetical protein [Gaiellaceae bacterium]